MTTFDLGPALLFCPADRPDRYRKALDRADAVILDLEDAVAPDRKAAARDALLAEPLDPARTIVRVNAVGTPEHLADLAALARTAYRTVMVPKADERLPLDLGGLRVVALCETAAGVLAAPELARRPGVVALMWGADDLVASLGGTSSRFPDGGYRDVARAARSAVLLAAGAAGIAAVDAVHLAIEDLDGLRDEALDAAAVGFAATACIHPSHVPVIRAAYAPPRSAVEGARTLLAAARGHDGVFVHDGVMIDGPSLRHAEAVLRRADAAGQADEADAAGSARTAGSFETPDTTGRTAPDALRTGSRPT
ncbi:HpcH/HpaI aldolase/citrate lyase family protein [Oerskovia enterophila]|uniref:Citrate lyase subunit beta-like protein n=1 Tax=Oerskovia enterophila TaxID=43678 RepID=A0ABX2YDV4_9CELL|nr:CoA ester lyase [Oerskovia enterophila]OCI32130.1 citrate lyase subunit beta-like protein [Oerskovia enterophila]